MRVQNRCFKIEESGRILQRFAMKGFPLGLLTIVLLVATQITFAQISRQALERRPAPPSAALNVMTYPGHVSGFVYWDTATVKHAGNCQGLSVAVSFNTTPPSSTPSFEQFKPLGTFNNFTYSMVGSQAVCGYQIDHVPEGKDLQIQVNVAQLGFSPEVGAGIPPKANDPNTPIRIPGGTCNKIMPQSPSLLTLESGWSTCGNLAFDVNFVLSPLPTINSFSRPGGAARQRQATLMGRAQSSYLASRSSYKGTNPANPGTISGAVWWDTTKVPVNSPNLCSTQLQVKANISKASPTPPFYQTTISLGNYQPTGALQFGSVLACTYEISNVPIGTKLSMQVVLGPGFNTAGNSLHEVAPTNQITIPGGNCTAAPPPINAVNQLSSPLTYCGKGAYNMTFSLAPTIIN